MDDTMPALNLYISRETDRKAEEIKKKKKGFTPSQFYREKIDELYDETFSKDLDSLKKKEELLAQQEKELNEEKERTKGLIEPLQKEEEQKQSELKKQEEEEKYSKNKSKIAYYSKEIYDNFNVTNKNEACDLAEEFCLGDNDDDELVSFVGKKGYRLLTKKERSDKITRF